MEVNRIPNLETTRRKGRPRNRWQDKRIVGGEVAGKSV
jgi:hypothetical protein